MTEDKMTEFKREYTEDIKYTAVAFANSEGGRILVGVNDDGTPAGVEDPDAVMLQLTNMIRNAVRPDLTLFSECTAEIMDGKTVIVLSIQRGTARPYYVAGKGIRPEGVYIRQGSSSVPASSSAILNMIRETAGDRYEAARSLDQHLTFVKTAEVFAEHALPFDDIRMRTMQMIGSDGMYTNLGMLLSDQCIHSLKLAVFDGSSKTVFRDRTELHGSLFTQIEEAYAYIDRFNHIHAEISGLSRKDTRDYPEEAIREALLNTVVHRDYSYSSPALISIFDDRMEFVTVGGLVPGLSLSDILLGVSVLRNQALGEIFYSLRLIEAYGTGIAKIRECYAGHDVKPVFEASDHAFRVILPNINRAVRKTPEEEMMPVRVKDREAYLLQLAEKKGWIVRRDVEDQLQVSQATAILILRDLVSRDLLVREGSGKLQRYMKAGKKHDENC